MGIVEEKAASLSCSADAIPTATFAWTVVDKEGVITDVVDGVTDATDGITVTSTFSLNDIDSKLSLAHITCTASSGGVSDSATFDMPEIATGGSAGIIIGILIGLLVLAIVLYVLYSRGIICKDDDKGTEDGKDDIEVGGGDVAAAPAEETQEAEVATEEEKAPLTNGDGAQ